YQAIPDVAPETLDRMVDIGFKAVVWGIQAAAEAMDAEHGGAIVNLASVAGIVSARNSIVYSGIKAGVMGITRAAAAELGARRIRVNAVAPSAVPTEGTVRNRNVERDAQRVARTPLGRLGTVEDIARVVCFLAGDASGYLTGQTIAADGGYTTAELLLYLEVRHRQDGAHALRQRVGDRLVDRPRHRILILDGIERLLESEALLLLH